MISKRIDAVTEIPENFKDVILPAPKSVKVELTSRCNYKCSFCAHQQGGKKHDDMDFELFKRLCNEMIDAGVEELGVFYIGESFLYPRLVEAIKYAKDIGFPYVFLTTNGSALTPWKTREVMDAGLDSLKFSMNYANENQYHLITKMSPNIFQRTIDNLKEAFKIRNEGEFSTKIYASSIKYNDDQQGAMEKLVEEIKLHVDEHYWLPLLSFGDQATEQEAELGIEPVRGNPGRLETMRAPLPCWAVFREGHITHDGKLSACCFDSSDKWIMSDLKDKSFMNGWNSIMFQKLRKAHLRGDVYGTACEACIYGGKNE